MQDRPSSGLSLAIHSRVAVVTLGAHLEMSIGDLHTLSHSTQRLNKNVPNKHASKYPTGTEDSVSSSFGPSVDVLAEGLKIITVAWTLHFTPSLRQMQCVSVYISYDNINNRHQGRSSPSYPSLPTTIRLNTTFSTHPHIPPIPIATVSARIPSQEPFPLSLTISPTKPRTSTLVLQLNSLEDNAISLTSSHHIKNVTASLRQ
jgi:hypothetical protein